MTQKNIYLHIGTHKTGTTALQNFFALNRKILKKSGIVYPFDIEGGGNGGHYRLFWALRRERGVRSERFPSNLDSASKEWELAMKQCDGQNGLISAEGLWLCWPEDLQAIKKLTAGFKVYIVVYLRRQDTMTMSRYNQVIKGGRVWTDHEVQNYPDYEKGLKVWADIFGKENIIVRPYEKQQFYKNTIFSDFLCHVLGLELTDDFIIPEGDVNSGFHHIPLEYKRMVNLLPISLEQKYELVKPLQRVSEIFQRDSVGKHSILFPQEQLDIIQQYAASNERIARDYLGREDGKLFFDPLPSLDKNWQTYECLTETDARIINQYLLEHYPSILHTVIGGIKKSLSSDDKAVREAVDRLIPGILEVTSKREEYEIALECKMAEISACCKFDLFRNWIYDKIPDRLKIEMKRILKKYCKRLKTKKGQ